jgi:hypothetical protein
MTVGTDATTRWLIPFHEKGHEIILMARTIPNSKRTNESCISHFVPLLGAWTFN